MKQPITVGKTVAYPVRRGSSMWLNRIEVEYIDYAGGKPVVVGYSPAGRRIRVKNAENCVVLHGTKVSDASS